MSNTPKQAMSNQEMLEYMLVLADQLEEVGISTWVWADYKCVWLDTLFQGPMPSAWALHRNPGHWFPYLRLDTRGRLYICATKLEVTNVKDKSNEH